MALDEDKIKDLFSSKLGDSFESDVPTSIWGGIDLLLSSQMPPVSDPGSSASSSSSSSSSTSAGTSVGGKIGIGLAIVAVIAAGALLYNKSSETVISNSEDMTIEAPQQAQTGVADTTLVLDTLAFIPPTITVHKTVESPEVTFTQMPIDLVPQLEDTLPAKQPVKKEPTIDTAEVEAIDSLPKPKKFYISIKGSQTLIGRGVQQYGPSGILITEPYRSQSFMSLLNEERGEYLLKHKQPISFSLLLGWQIKPRLSLETGILYTHLESTLSSTSRFNLYETQKLNYIGIPLNLKYTFYKLGKADFYLSLGALGQKDFSGTLVARADIPNAVDGNYPIDLVYLKTTIGQANIQFSAHGAFGITYPLYRNLYIYGGLNGAYYFDAQNKYRTIYSDQKFNMNGDLGLKFNF